MLFPILGEEDINDAHIECTMNIHHLHLCALTKTIGILGPGNSNRTGVAAYHAIRFGDDRSDRRFYANQFCALKDMVS